MRQLHYIFATLSLALVGVILPDDVVAQYYPERRMVRKGNEQFDARNYRKSYNLYQDAYEVDSTQYEVLYNRANGYYHNAIGATSEEFSIEKSNAMYERIVADTLLSDVQRAEVFRNLGESLFMQQKYEEALNSFRESLRLNPNDSETKYNYVLTKRIVDQKRAMQNQNQDQNQDQNQNGGGGSDSSSRIRTRTKIKTKTRIRVRVRAMERISRIMMTKTTPTKMISRRVKVMSRIRRARVTLKVRVVTMTITGMRSKMVALHSLAS